MAAGDAQPRLVVATESGGTVLDAADGTPLGSFETVIGPRPSSRGRRPARVPGPVRRRPHGGLRIDSLDTTVVESGAPHHGVVVPLTAEAVVSIPPPPGDDTLPTGVAVVDAKGVEIVRFDDCCPTPPVRWTSTATWSCSPPMARCTS